MVGWLAVAVLRPTYWRSGAGTPDRPPSVQQRCDLFQRPDVIGHAGSHRGSPRVALLQAPMRASEVVVHEVQGDRMGEVLDFAAEPVGEPREAPHPHPHRQVLALDVAGRDPAGVGVALDDPPLGPDADRGAVFADLAARVLLLDLSPVHVVPEGRPYRPFVDPVAIGAELDAPLQPARQVGQEDFCVVAGPLADRPSGHQLRIGVNRREGPHVAVTGRPFELLRNVLLLRVTEGPNLIDLQHLAGESLENAVLVLGAGFAEVGQQLDDGVLGRAGHPDGGSDAVALHEASDYPSPLLSAQPVHVESVVHFALHMQNHLYLSIEMHYTAALWPKSRRFRSASPRERSRAFKALLSLPASLFHLGSGRDCAFPPLET